MAKYARRRLILMRHGKSDWNAGVRDDYDRPLKRRGRVAARRMGKWCAEVGLSPDVVITSGAARAADTARLFSARASGAGITVQVDDRLYSPDLGDHLEVIAAISPAWRQAVVVGHNPGLESVLEYLAKRLPHASVNGKMLPTGAIAVLALPAGWSKLSPGSCRVEWLQRPRELAREGE